MAIRQYTYQGKTLEELQKMNFNDFINLLPSRQRRSLKRGFTDAQKKLLEKIKKFKEGKKKKPVRRQEKKIGRNDPCPCGSGKKYKKCHGRA